VVSDGQADSIQAALHAEGIESPVDATWRSTLESLRNAAGLPIAFGGPVSKGAILLAHVSGNRSEAMRGLAIEHGAGLGGRAYQHAVPCAVDDYSRSAEISHHYDLAVQAERMRAVVAVPITVRGHVRGVIYGATRDHVGCGDRMRYAVAEAGRRLALEVAVEDEIERRLADRAQEDQRAQRIAVEKLRRLHVDLTDLLHSVRDSDISSRVESMLETLQSVSSHGGEIEGAAGGVQPRVPQLSSRERHVLTYVAAGLTYSEVADRLGLKAQTVKSYMRDLLHEFDAHSRHEAVVRARRLGLIP
jgi:DNA-binding CsgD family transcriptional regulator